MVKKIFISLLIFIIIIKPIKASDYNKGIIDITKLSIKEIQSAVADGYISYEQIIRLYLDRIEAYDKNYNSIITINEKALTEAKKLDQEYKDKGPRSLIHGLPIVVKDNIDVIGMPTTVGTKALSDAYPNSNAPVIQKLIDAGAIIIAKTNMSQFAFSASTSYSNYGYVKNAYNLAYSSYGSSGGTAVAVAASFAVVGLGTDTNSSVRVPASANNVIGLRPTLGLLNNTGVVKYDSTRDTIGVMSKSIEDNAIVLSIIDDKADDYLKSNNNTNEITIGVIKEFMSDKNEGSSSALVATDKEIIKMLNDKIDYLKNKGLKIVYIDEIWDGYYSFMGKLFCYDFNNYIKNTTSKIQSLNDLIKKGGFIYSISKYNNEYCNYDYKNTSAYKKYISKNNNYKAKIKEKFQEYNVDAIIYPTLKSKVQTIANAENYGTKSPSYTIAPPTGFPAMSVPMGFGSDNLPYGIEILSIDNNEALLYKIGLLIEESNSSYITPAIAPSLYQVPDNIDKLMKYYKDYRQNQAFEKTNNETKKFLNNYSTLDDPIINENINNLINEYEETKLDYQQTNKSKIITYFIIITFILLIIKKFLTK